jgi:Fibronectin type III domain
VLNIQYSTDGGANWASRSPSSTASPITITGLTNGTTYEVQLRLVTSTGPRDSSASATGTPRTTPAAPGAPTGVAGNTEVTLTWAPPDDDGGDEITGYTVQSSTNGTTYTDQAGCTGLGPVLTCTATGLTSGTAYTFKVAAINDAGTGTYSAASAAITPVAATCAAGGTCRVGDTGPGGGTVFYVGQFTLTSTDQTMRYLEVAPTSGGTAWTDVRVAWSGNTSQSVSTSQNLGTGAKNTANMIAQAGGGSTANRAATSVAAYAGGGLTDWFLPSYRELEALQLSGLGGTYQSPGYWTSSQFSATTAFTRSMSNGATPTWAKSTTRWVRPIRAFGVVN